MQNSTLALKSSSQCTKLTSSWLPLSASSVLLFARWLKRSVGELESTRRMLLTSFSGDTGSDELVSELYIWAKTGARRSCASSGNGSGKSWSAWFSGFGNDELFAREFLWPTNKSEVIYHYFFNQFNYFISLLKLFDSQKDNTKNKKNKILFSGNTYRVVLLGTNRGPTNTKPPYEVSIQNWSRQGVVWNLQATDQNFQILRPEQKPKCSFITNHSIAM